VIVTPVIDVDGGLVLADCLIILADYLASAWINKFYKAAPFFSISRGDRI
jgi:hypothetical protein